MRTKRLYASCLFAFAFVLTGFFQLKPSTVDIIEYGLLAYGKEEVIDAPELPSGKRGILSEIQWVKKTSTIPAELGVSFGIEFIIRGDPNETINVTEIIIFPDSGLTNPKTGMSLKVSPHETEIYKNSGEIFCYTFDEPWEILKGEWIYQVKTDDKLLLEKRFTVE